MSDPEIGRAINRHRTRAGLSMRDLADRVGCSAAHVCDIEHGRRFPSTDLLASICMVLEAPFTELDAIGRCPCCGQRLPR